MAKYYKYDITLNDRKYAVKVSRLSDKKVQVSVDGESFEVNVEEKFKPSMLPPPTDSLGISTSQPTESSGSASTVTAQKVQSASGPGVVRAPIPGKVVKTLVSAGDSVKKGQIIVHLEAMKMVNEISSSVDGKVKDIVSTGINVGYNEVLANIIPE